MKKILTIALLMGLTASFSANAAENAKINCKAKDLTAEQKEACANQANKAQ